MIIRRQKPIEFSGPAEVLFDRKELKKAIKWYSKKPVARLKRVYLHGRYYAVSIYERKIHIHRLLMMYWEKRDLEPNEYVHHEDGNRNNNLKENLRIMSCSEHQSLHRKGVSLTEEHKRNIGLANRNRKGMKYKKRPKNQRSKQ